MGYQNSDVPFFMTHHAPVGAWSSFTFGLPGKGVSIDHESPSVENTADFLVAVSRGTKKVAALPFISGIINVDNEMIQTGASTAANNFSIKDRWSFIPPKQIKRRLSSCIDEYSGGEIALKVYTPHSKLPDPDQGHSLKYACCPGILIELTIDNTEHEEAAVGFIGLAYQAKGRIYPLDWTTDEALSGVGFSNKWALGARTMDKEVFTIRDNVIAQHVELGQKVVHNGGKEGGIAFTVPPLSKKTLTVAFGFFNQGKVTQGLIGNYLFNRYFSRVEEVCEYILDHADIIREDCQKYDRSLRDEVKSDEYQVFCQSLRAYYANTQLIECDDRIYYNVSEGQYFWRNTLDLAVDHLPFELSQNPWVVKNIMDLFIDRYSYYDGIRFFESPGKVFPGGLSFTHDMGNYTAYSPKGFSGYEMTNTKGYSYMTIEELLNGIYCIASYAITTKDMKWIHKKAGIVVDLLISMENRDHYDPLKRNGILKGESMRCGESGKEITTYDALDHSLLSSIGNLYVAVKTMCSAMLLSEFFHLAGLPDYAVRAENMLLKTKESLKGFFDEQVGCFKANIYSENTSKVIAAVEPFAVPIFLGLKSKLVHNTELKVLFDKHIKTCLKPGNCLDEKSGGLKLSSTSRNTWPSKVILCMYVMEEMFDMDLQKEYSSLMRELCCWIQTSAAERTISDQIICDTGVVIGGSYYPRHITSALWSVKHRV
jgi:xylan 1,4-beta-xylosidase